MTADHTPKESPQPQTMNPTPFKWLGSEYAQAYFSSERPKLELGLRQAIGPSTLQVGSMIDESLLVELDLPLWVKARMGRDEHAHFNRLKVADVATDPAFLPFSQESFSTVILPHVLEAHYLPHQVLREAHRVIQHEGYIVVTGFNPASIMGVQRWLRPKAAKPGRYYTPKRVIDWLQVLGFEVVASSMFHYAPLTRKPRVRKMFGFLDSVGDRWLPMFGGGYMIAAKKREPAGTLVGRVKFRKPKLASPAPIQVRKDVSDKP